MKLNWGFGIALFYSIFMVVLLYFVIKSTTYDNSLVVDNYYEEDLKYQSHYDKKLNAQDMAGEIKVDYHAAKNQIAIRFPEAMKSVSGTVHFYCPSTKHQDVIKALKLDPQGQMFVPTKLMKSGRWKVKLDWENDGKAFYKETEIIL